MKWLTGELRLVLIEYTMGPTVPNKYGSLQLRIKAASLQAQVTEDKLNVSLPDFGAPNNQILRQTIRAYLLRSPKPWNAVFKILL